jgi:DNA-binding NarL/FixJ family response regulator
VHGCGSSSTTATTSARSPDPQRRWFNKREAVRAVQRGHLRELVISRLTAKTHITRAIAKLGARDRVQLVIIACEDGLVGPLS